jgi:hypothetical protein
VDLEPCSYKTVPILEATTVLIIFSFSFEAGFSRAVCAKIRSCTVSNTRNLSSSAGFAKTKHSAKPGLAPLQGVAVES